MVFFLLLHALPSYLFTLSTPPYTTRFNIFSLTLIYLPVQCDVPGIKLGNGMLYMYKWYIEMNKLTNNK